MKCEKILHKIGKISISWIFKETILTKEYCYFFKHKEDYRKLAKANFYEVKKPKIPPKILMFLETIRQNIL